MRMSNCSWTFFFVEKDRNFFLNAESSKMADILSNKAPVSHEKFVFHLHTKKRSYF